MAEGVSRAWVEAVQWLCNPSSQVPGGSAAVYDVLPDLARAQAQKDVVAVAMMKQVGVGVWICIRECNMCVCCWV